jgi:hypothetical protein
MPVSGGGFDQCYNAQAGVDTASQLILCNHVTQKPNDIQEVKPAVEQLLRLDPKMGKLSAFLADNGYFGISNCSVIEQAGMTPYIASGREQHNQTLEERFFDPPGLHDNPDMRSTMRHRLRTKLGKALYASRKSTVEPVFGIIKHVMGFRQFSFRGFEKVQGEWNLVSIAWNLKRMHALT